MNPNNDDILMPEFRGFRSFTLKTSEDQVPPNLILHANYPNPFNPTTNISFSIPVGGKVKLEIYNLKGQKVAEPVNRELASGKHSVAFDGVDSQNRGLASGVYLLRFQYPGGYKTKKVTLMK